MSALNMNDSMDRDNSALNRSFNTVTSLNSSQHTTASSSKAVLAALRALQDKIRRLEAERSQALDEASDLRTKIKSFEIETEHSRQRDAMQSQRQVQEARVGYEKLFQEKKDLEERLIQVEERNRHDETQLRELSDQSGRLSETKSMSDMKLQDLTAKVETLESHLYSSQQREKGEH
jgi:chromosome segregation ATPase